jgi:hypothetical protein
MKRRLAAVLLLAMAGAAGAQTWDFDVRLDGKPIGTHRFVVSGPASAREVDSNASFDVKLLGIPVYRYRHQARERWAGDCLRELQSRTDDDGKPVRVDERRDTNDCVMGFAYWHPRMNEQTRLLNPQTGLIEDVRFERLPEATLVVRGATVGAVRWRLSTPAQELTVWRDRSDGAWIGLDARVKGDRLLTYRLP